MTDKERIEQYELMLRILECAEKHIDFDTDIQGAKSLTDWLYGAGYRKVVNYHIESED